MKAVKLEKDELGTLYINCDCPWSRTSVTCGDWCPFCTINVDVKRVSLICVGIPCELEITEILERPPQDEEEQG